jgi:hypothetical protein
MAFCTSFIAPILTLVTSIGANGGGCARCETIDAFDRIAAFGASKRFIGIENLPHRIRTAQKEEPFFEVPINSNTEEISVSTPTLGQQ